MGELNCPFLGVKKMLFCKAHPTVLIPFDESLASGSICTGEHHRECPSFRELDSPTLTSKPVEEGESHGTLACSANVGCVCGCSDPNASASEGDS
jgi:hypothetical protein